jgi:hypothetical protein
MVGTHAGDLSSSSYPLAQMLLMRLANKLRLLPNADNLVEGNALGAPRLFGDFEALSPEVAEYMARRTVRPETVSEYLKDRDGNLVLDSEGRPKVKMNRRKVPVFDFNADPSFLDKYDFLRVDPDDTFVGDLENTTGRIDPKATPGTIIMVNKATGNVEGRLPALSENTVLNNWYIRPLQKVGRKFGFTIGDGGDLPLPTFDPNGYRK